MHPDIFAPRACLVIVFLCSLTTNAPLTVKHIFEDNHNWAAFHLAEKDNLRDTETKEGNKMLSCKDESRGFFTCECENCKILKTVYFGCNSRICTNCGKNHTDKWAKSLGNALFNVPHRHAVLTIPAVLWPIVRENRFLHKVLMDAAIAAINDTISHKHRNGQLTAGAIVVLHPFSKRMSNNPHLHILVTEGGFEKCGRFIHQKISPFNAMRKTWQYQALTQFKAAFPKTRVFAMLVDQLFKKYREGFYVHLPKESRITNKRKIARYVARYTSIDAPKPYQLCCPLNRDTVPGSANIPIATTATPINIILLVFISSTFLLRQSQFFRAFICLPHELNVYSLHEHEVAAYTSSAKTK